MRRTLLAGLCAACAGARGQPDIGHTRVTIDGERFLINGLPTYPGRALNERSLEGMLLNARLIQGIWDDENPLTRPRWAYPDTGVWDAERNTSEFIAAMPVWRAHGLLSFTIGMQGGSPEGYSQDQPWLCSGFDADGALKPAWFERLRRVLDCADALGMAPIVSLFYFGQDQRIRNEAGLRRAVTEACIWILENGWRNVLIEIANECDVRSYDHDVLKPHRIHELIALARSIERRSRSLLVGTSFAGGRVPNGETVAASDFVLLHGNGVRDPERIAQMVDATRALPSWSPKPILFNEDDHFDFDQPRNNMFAALQRGASWGYFDPGQSNYRDGYQCPPVNWTLSTDRKRAFFETVRRLTTQTSTSASGAA